MDACIVLMLMPTAEEKAMRALRLLLGYALPLFLICGTIDFFAEFPWEGPAKWGLMLLISLLVSTAAMTTGYRRPFHDLENKHSVNRRMRDTERDAKRW